MVSLEAAARAEIQRGIARQRKGLKLQGGFWGVGETRETRLKLQQFRNLWRKRPTLGARGARG